MQQLHYHTTIKHIHTELTEDQNKLSKSKRQRAKHWVQWWTRPKHLKMLCKPFTEMSSGDWEKCPRNTNGVERANGLAKVCDRKLSLYGAMQSLYEKDKAFALQYISAYDGVKTSYRSVPNLAQRSNAAVKRKVRQPSAKDNECSFGPPDKKQYFSSVPGKKSKKGKGNSKVDDKRTNQIMLKKWKLHMWMESGTKDGFPCPASISRQENGRCTSIMTTKQLKLTFLRRMSS